MTESQPLPGVSLFSGAGGLDIGLSKAGVVMNASVEIDRDSRGSLLANKLARPETLFEDIRAVEPADLQRAGGTTLTDPFVVAGGPPCQAFSTAGRRASNHDPRGAVVESYFHIVNSLKPRFFVFENVRGLLSSAVSHRPLELRGADSPALRAEERLGSLFETVLMPKFDAMGYEVFVGLVDAADYGVPQRRTRVIILGSRDHEFRGEDFEKLTGRPLTLTDIVRPTHSAPMDIAKSKMIAAARPSRRRKPWVSLWRAIGRRPPVGTPEVISYSPARRAVYDVIPMGENWRYLRDYPENVPADLLRAAMGGALDSTGGRVGFWRRLSWQDPCPTLTTSPVQKATGLCHPEETRPLSIQEYKRIQQYPARYRLRGGIGSKYRQLGNAVPVGLARAIGAALVRTADGYPWSADSLAAQAEGEAIRLQISA